MSKSARLFFSREHTSHSHPELHTDSYRQTSSSSHTEKTGHNECEPRSVPVRTESSNYGEKSSGDSCPNVSYPFGR